MLRSGVISLAITAVAMGIGSPRPVSAQGADLAGTWVLNWGASQFPSAVGFGMDLLPIGATGDTGAGFTGGSGAPVLAPSRESEIDAKNTKQLVEEVRRPPLWLRVTESGEVVSITDDRGHTRTFTTNGKEGAQRLEAGPVPTTARWEGRQLVVRYRVSAARELRYTYGRTPDGARLSVEVRFIERGGRDSVTRTYDPLPPGALLPSPEPTPTRAPAAGAGALAGTTPADVPASGGQAAAPLGSVTPDAELAGIRAIGLVVEELTAQAAACGLDRAAIEAAVSTSLTAAGFKVARNADEDTYLYVDIITASISNGLCVSRFDASLFTHTTATLTHQSSPLLVRVLLLHDGAMAGGTPKEHVTRLMESLVQKVDQFGVRINAAGR